MSREQTECGETQLDQAGRKIRRESAFDRWKDAWWQTPTEGLLSDTKCNQHAVPGRKNGHQTLAPCKCSPALLAYRACVREHLCKSPDRPTRPRFLLAPRRYPPQRQDWLSKVSSEDERAPIRPCLARYQFRCHELLQVPGRGDGGHCRTRGPARHQRAGAGLGFAQARVGVRATVAGDRAPQEIRLRRIDQRKT